DIGYASQVVTGKSCIEFAQCRIRIVRASGKSVGAQQIYPREPKVRPHFNRLPQPHNRIFIVLHYKIRSPNYPIKHANGWIARAKPYGFERERRGLLRTSEEYQLPRLLRVSKGKVGIELERPIEGFQRALMVALCTADRTIREMRQRDGGIQSQRVL